MGNNATSTTISDTADSGVYKQFKKYSYPFLWILAIIAIIAIIAIFLSGFALADKSSSVISSPDPSPDPSEQSQSPSPTPSPQSLGPITYDPTDYRWTFFGPNNQKIIMGVIDGEMDIIIQK